MDQFSLLIFKNMLKTMTKGFSVVGGVYSFYSIFQQILPKNKLPLTFDFQLVLILFITSCVFFIVKDAYNLFYQKHYITATNKSIAIRVADILSYTDGTILVGINDGLICDANKIGKNSIHYQLIRKYGIDWISNIFDVAKQKAVANSEGQYANGYVFTAYSPDEKQHFAFIVMSRLKENSVPESTLSNVYQALKVLFSDGSSFRCVNNKLYAPILGTGAVALSYSRQKMIELIAFAFVPSSTNNSTAVHDLIITFRKQSLEKINLLTLNDNLKLIVDRCHNCPGNINERSSDS